MSRPATIRPLTESERERYAQAIHRLTKRESEGGFRGLPALRCAFAALVPFVDESCSSAYTDCLFRVGFSPAMLDPQRTSLEQLAFTIAHETLHNTQRHGTRLQELDDRLANIAGDLEINAMLVAGLLGVDLANPDPDRLMGVPYSVRAEDGSVQVSAYVPGFPPVSDLPLHETAERYGALLSGAVKSNPSLAVVLVPWDEFGFDPNDPRWAEAEAAGAHPLPAAEEERVRAAVASDAEAELQRARQSRGWGDDPLMKLMTLVIRAMAPPRVDWRRVLSSVVSRTASAVSNGRTDYSFARRNRRHAYDKAVFPGFCDYRPTISVAVDTSGSMGAEELRRAAFEVNAVIRNIASDIDFFCVDVQASKPVRTRNVQEAFRTLLGGGGTDMAAAVDAACAERRGRRPDVLLVITDGMTEWGWVEQSLRRSSAAGMGFVFCIVGQESDLCDADLASMADRLARVHRNARVVACAV